MLDKRVGINLPDTPLDTLARKLEHYARAGFGSIEINLGMYPFITCGKIHEGYVRSFGNILRSSGLDFTAHIVEGLDLRNVADYDLHKTVLLSSVEVCAMLGMKHLTVHFEKKSLDYLTEHAFVEGHIEAAEKAASLNVKIGIENIEVDDYRNVIDCVKKVNNKAFGMTFDTGHMFLTSNYFHFDYLEAVKECAPYVCHVHLSDNNGIYEELRMTNWNDYKALSMPYRIAFGRGDVHLPPYWGDIPMDEVITILEGHGFDGIYICEYNVEYFAGCESELRQKVSEAIRRANTEKNGILG